LPQHLMQVPADAERREQQESQSGQDAIQDEAKPRERVSAVNCRTFKQRGSELLPHPWCLPGT
jgi:hypothetical protein